MATISAQNVDIDIEAGYWRLYQQSDRLIPPLLFEAIHGSGLLQYKSTFGQEIGLPGNRLATTYVRAVVVGYNPKLSRWLLGLHVSNTPEEKPRWVQLVRWPQALNKKHADMAQSAGRALAEYIGCPLKVFGTKKVSTANVTGPIEKHERMDMHPSDVRRSAKKVKLPIECEGVWLGPGRHDGLTLRNNHAGGKHDAGQVTPAYQLCEINPKKKTVKMVPPTGLLSAFFGGLRGREIEFESIRNIELRHVIETTSAARRGEADGMLVEISTTHRYWRVYLTLRDENVLLTMTSHSTSSDLTRHRVTGGAAPSATESYHTSVQYYRELENDQKCREAACQWAEQAAVVLAAMIGRPLVKTQVGQEMDRYEELY